MPTRSVSQPPLRGVVKRLVKDKGFGFLQSATGGDDVFFHRSSLPAGEFDRLTEGDAVDYAASASPKGPRADSVSLVTE